MSKKHLTVHNRERERHLFTKRVTILTIVVIIFSLCLISRLIDLQIFQHQLYTTLSKQNQLNLLPIPPTRGLIFDRNGVLLAENLPVFSLEVHPDHVKNLKTTLQAIQKIIALTPDDIKEFYKQLKQRRRYDPIPLRLKLTEDEVARFAVNRYFFPGVEVKARLIRHYRYGAEFSHVLGYVGRINTQELETIDVANYSASNFIGKVGIEKYYEKTLQGKVGYEQVETDASGRIIRTISRTPPVPGNDIYLTIDSGLERAAEQALTGLRGAVVVIDPNNGEVLALVSSPSYDPNLFVKGVNQSDYDTLRNSPDRPLYNRSIRGQYPIASTIKPFIGLQAIESGVVTPSYRLWDPGWFRLPNTKHIYKDYSWKNGGHGWVNLSRAIAVSCDTYFFQIAKWMGISQIDSILIRFGFGSPTGIEIQEELPGLVPTPTWKMGKKGKPWYTGDTIVSGIGQGYLLTTPLQLAAGIAAIATHGIRYQIHLQLKQRLHDNTFTNYLPETLPPVRLNHTEAWDLIIDAMHKVITEGTGYRFGRDTPYTVAGKTGTAQVFSATFHAPMQDKDLPEQLRDHSLFVAFAPLNQPKIAIAVVVENSSEASPVARKVMDYYLLHLNLDRTHNGAPEAASQQPTTRHE